MFDREKLKQYMKDNGISAAELARQLGVSGGAIRHIMAGVKQPSLAMTVEFAKMMECSVDELCLKDPEE